MKKISKQEVIATYGPEPTLTGSSSMVEITQALSWYSNGMQVDNKTRKSYFLDEFKKHKDVKHYKSLPDFRFVSIGIFARLMGRGLILPDNMQESFDARVASLLLCEASVVEPVVTAKPKKAKVDPMAVFAAEMEYQIDLFLENNCKTKFDPEAFIKSCKLNIGGRYNLRSWFKDLHAELDLLCHTSDKELQEGYSFLTKAKQKRFYNFVDEIVNAKVSEKSTKPRKVKAISPTKRVKKMKFKKVGSIAPEGILGANVLWTWNADSRKLSLYQSNIGFDVKGSTLLNVDVAEIRRIRKPEMMKTFVGTQKKMMKKWNELTTKSAEASTRINGKLQLLKVF